MRKISSLPPFRQYENVVGGVGLILFGILVMWVSRDYPVGTASNMGPGYFPRALSIIIIGLGALLALVNLRKPLEPEDSEEVLRLRPLLLVAGSYVAFAVALRPLGLLPAVLILIVVSGLAAPRRSLAEWALIVILLEGLTYLLWYVVGISVPLVGGN